MSDPLRILLLEDSPTDAELSERLLRKAGMVFSSLRVETRQAFMAALEEFRPDLILADYKLPGFDGLQALSIVRERSPDLPYIFVTGAMGEDWAVEVLRQGATDYVLKEGLARLPATVRRALAEKEARGQKRDAESQFARFMEVIPALTYIKDSDGRVLYVNPMLEAMIGTSDWKDKHTRDLFPGQLGLDMERDDRQALAQGYLRVEEAVTQSDGSKRYFETHKFSIPRQAAPPLLAGVTLDITERKLQEERIRQLQIEQQAVLDHVQVGIVHLKQRRIVSYNRRLVELFGCDRDELAGESTEKIFDSQEDFLAFGARAYAALEEHGVFKEDLLLRRKDGSQFWAALVGRAVDPERPLEGSVWVCADISERKEAELRIQESEQRYRTLADTGQALVWASGTDKLCNYFNRIWLEFTGRSLEQELGNGWAEGVHPDDYQRCLDTYVAAFDQREQFSIEYRLRRHDGEYRWIQDDGCPRYDSQGEFIGYIGHCLDITERKLMEQELIASEQRFRGAIESMRDAFVLIEAENGGVLVWNRAAEKLFGYCREEALGQPLFAFISPSSAREELMGVVKRLASDGENLVVEKLLELSALNKFGREIPVELSFAPLQHGGEWYVSCVVRDIRERKHYLAQLERQSNYDDLTRLPNRNLLTDRLSQAIAHCDRYQKQLAILAFNLDHFKQVNDSLGFTVGDELLSKVVSRLRPLLRGEETFARFGGDQFVILQELLAEPQEAAVLAKRILEALSQPFALNTSQEIFLSASIGIALCPSDGGVADDLLRNADVAVFQAKSSGGNRFRFYTQDMNTAALADLEMEALLRRALDRNELVLHYQPQVDLQTGKINGAEALLRWDRNEQGLVPPQQFIPLAEKSDLIIDIGNWVIDAACRQLRVWRDEGLRALRVSVNVSARQFQSGNLPDEVARALARHEVLPQYLMLELTESMLMARPEESIVQLREIKRIGVGISLDDFGSGYSSLAYLSRFPIDALKIDQSFVRDIATEPTSATIATSIISLAHRLNLQVVAEGVENDMQLGYLRMNQCDNMQGFNFSRALPADQFADLLRQEKSIAAARDQDDAGRRTLLIVDDEANILSALRRMLHQEGYRILTADSASSGLEVLAQNSVQVILSDQRMPEMNGTEFLRRVKELHPNTVRIVLSGYTDLESVTQSINEGALYKFLTKPWTDEQLREQIRDAFRYYDAVIKPRSNTA
ncbi:MAG: Cyclic di-GMP phosphodiesterase Gmr [Betaproteobacteria bacterium ADurb.Bin341]|nr:MAG: Cyclic di-GMP phosphodiesterase Gmr [Betaproteobacteria bacterium ADurb.Bin341]